MNIFKKENPEKKEPKKAMAKVKVSKTAKKSKTEVDASPIKNIDKVNKNRKKSGKAFQVLNFPHITEKASGLTANGQYVFKVWKSANKIEIKRAIEDVYGVNVVAVNIINVPGKERRVGKRTGLKKGYKKAIVKVMKGQKIEVLPV